MFLLSILKVLIVIIGFLITLRFLIVAIFKQSKRSKYLNTAFVTFLSLFAALILITLIEFQVYTTTRNDEDLILTAGREANIGGIWLGLYNDSTWHIGSSPREIKEKGRYELSYDSVLLFDQFGGLYTTLKFEIENNTLIEFGDKGIKWLEIGQNRITVIKPHKELISEADDWMENWVIDSTLFNSPFRALYINELAKRDNRQLEVRIPFDLHGFDCGAPDCYTTEISFSTELADELTIPNLIAIDIKEDGCIDGFKAKTEMHLKESTATSLHYYSKDKNTSLIIMGVDPRGEYVYYFTSVSERDIQIDDFDEIMDKMEESENANAPYRLTTLIGENNRLKQMN